MKGTLEATVAS